MRTAFLAALAINGLFLFTACGGQGLITGTSIQNHTRQVRSGSAGAFDAAVLALSPYAYYKLNETSGTVAIDSSGNGRNGSYKGTPGTDYFLGRTSIVPGDSSDFTTGFARTSISSPKVALPNLNVGSNGTTWQSDFTVALWMKPDSSMLAQFAEPVEINDYSIGQGSSSGGAQQTAFGTWYPVTTTVTPNNVFEDGAVHFLAITIHRESSGTCDVLLYDDGVLSNRIIGSTCAGNNSAYVTNAGIGARVSYSAGYAPFLGQVADVAVFSSALSGAAIASLFDSVNATTTYPATSAYDSAVFAQQPYAYYRLDETSGTIAKDYSGNGRDGVYRGAPGTDYALGGSSIIPGYTSGVSTAFFATAQSYPKVELPNANVGLTGGLWESDYSVSLWLKPDSTALSQFGEGVEVNDFYAGIGGAHATAASTPIFGSYNVADSVSPNPIFTDSKAHLLLLTIHQNPTSGKCDSTLYVDGNATTSLNEVACSGSNFIYSSNFSIASRNSYSPGYAPFRGQIAGVAIFTKTLTSTDASNLYSESGNGYDNEILSLGPYAYYKLNETTGTTAVDTSGNNRSGTYLGTPGTDYSQNQTSIVPGSASGDLAIAPTATSFPKVAFPNFGLGSNGSTWISDFTAMLWMQPAASALTQFGEPLEINDYYFGQGGLATAPGTTAVMGAYTVEDILSSTNVFSDGKPHFIAMTVHEITASSCVASLFSDGNFSASFTGSCAGNNIAYSTNAALGRVSYSGGYAPFNGTVADVAVYSYALSAGQISAIYAAAH